MALASTFSKIRIVKSETLYSVARPVSNLARNAHLRIIIPADLYPSSPSHLPNERRDFWE